MCIPVSALAVDVPLLYRYSSGHASNPGRLRSHGFVPVAENTIRVQFTQVETQVCESGCVVDNRMSGERASVLNETPHRSLFPK